MPKQELAVKSYPTLLSQLKKVFIEGLQKIEEEKVKAYWRTGELISNYILKNKERAKYGENIFNKLEKDLGIERSTLERTVKFYRTYPIVGARPQLNWLHYRTLITIEDKSKRKLFEEQAIKKDWGVRELAEAVRLDRLEIEGPAEKPAPSDYKLSVTRSRLYTYQVLEPSYIHPVEEYLSIDLGFNFLIQAEMKGLRLKSGDIIESQKKGSTYIYSHSEAKPKELYTYKALVERVVDADTIYLNIDLGFSSWYREKVRLRGIDTPEMDTEKGQRAKRFVEARLKEVEFVVAKTYKEDKYERFLADIFYPPLEPATKTQAGSPNICGELRRAGFEGATDPQKVLKEGTFLNQELLDQGLAEPM